MSCKLKLCMQTSEQRKNRRITINYLLLIFTCFAVVNCSSNQEKNCLSFSEPLITYGADESLVQRIESAVIIPGDSHKDLWVHPEIVTIPGDSIVCELRARTTDRCGGDYHTKWHYFRTYDFFKSIYPVKNIVAEAWNKTYITPNNIDTTLNPNVYPSLPSGANWSWYMNYIHLDSETILQPFYTNKGQCHFVQTVTARIECEKIVPLHISNACTNYHKRGFLEPHLAQHEGRYFMTVRAEDNHGYVMTSNNNGGTWESPISWKWDNGDEIPMHTTMTKILSHSEGLTLVYTRIHDENKNVFRNRAPLYIADIDMETLSIKRATERIIVPNMGLPVGNFWVCSVNQDESYVVTAEWPRDGDEINGDIWLAKIKWRAPNNLMTNEGFGRIVSK